MSDERQKMDDLLGWFQRSVSRSEMDNLRAEILGRFDAVVAERNAAHERLADWEETHRQVMAEACGDGGPLDARHCTCVPELRRGIRELVAERDAAQAEVEGLRAERDHHRSAHHILGQRVLELKAQVQRLDRQCAEMNDECNVLTAEAKALRARMAELEDAERIAWCLTVGRSLGLDLYVQHTARTGLVSQWILDTPTNGKVLLNLCISKNPLSMPFLTPEARALIDAARDNTKET